MRQPHSVFLLAVSKGQPIEKIQQAVAAGQVAFGENYLQEALPKIIALADKKLEWHFIGIIQTNKTKKIADYFSWVHSLSDTQSAQRLNEQRASHLPPLNICLQVNTSQEPTKSGVQNKEVFPLAEYCASLPRLRLRGLMTIAAPKKQFSAQRSEFHRLRVLYDKLNARGFKLDTLSMGMSNDMQAAIAEGATIVRIGTAIFGERTV